MTWWLRARRFTQRVRGYPVDGRRQGRFVSERREEIRGRARARGQSQAAQPTAGLRGCGHNGLQLDWQNYQPPRPSFLGTRVFDDFPLKNWWRLSTGRPFLSPGSWRASSRDPRRRKGGRAGRELYATRRQCWTASSTRNCSPPGPPSASGRRHASARTISRSTRMKPQRDTRHAAPPAPADGKAQWRSQCQPGRLHRALDSRPRTTLAASA